MQFIYRVLKRVAWWRDAMHMMQRWNATDQTNDKETTTNNRKTPGTSVSGRYNTPALREDLVPRSRMAPEGKTEEKEKR